MKFKYKRFSPAFIRPIIPIKIGYGGITVEQGVLVDSGADICLFDARIGKLIGVPVEQGEPRVFRGATAAPQTYYMHPITIEVGGWKYKIKAGFVPDFAPRYGIVGQVGFFNFFTIKFDYRKEEIEIKPVEERK